MLRSLLFIIVMTLGLWGCANSPSPVKPPKPLLPVENAFTIKRIWHDDLGEGASDNYLRLTPVIKDKVIFSAHYDGLIKAYNMRTSDSIWTFQASSKLGSPLVLHEGVIYFGTSKGEVYALQAETGTLIWKVIVSSEVLAAPAVGNGYVAVRCVNGELHTLNSKDGSEVWSNLQRTPSLTLRGTSAPVIYNDLVLSAYDNGMLLAFNLQTGNILWQTAIATPHGRSPLERIVDIDAELIIDNDVVYAIAFQSKLAAVQVGSGQIIWSRDIGSYIGMSVDAYRVYIADSDSKLWALDRTNGATLWKQDAVLRRSVSKPSLHKGYVIVGDFNGFLHWFNRVNGKLEARARLNEFEYTNPDLDETEDLLYPKTNDILATPILDGNVLIAMDRHGNSEAFEIIYP